MPGGCFITFEGPDGSGKSTQLRLLAAFLEAQGLEVTVTRQPGGTALGERIRSLLLDSRAVAVAPRAELGLMFADRAQLIASVIAPALGAGGIVLCDRFTDSTEAYQGGGRRLGADTVLELDRIFCSGVRPALTLLLLPDLERSLARARRRNHREEAGGRAGDESRFEREHDDFHRRVYAQYQAIARREPGRVVAIPGNAGIEAVHRQITGIVADRLGLRKTP